ncbi:hypothetical protein PTSG_01394 [Salpingoeca rosetta]|uniref:Ras-GEF domain-containing protein n=1 Tax=Salpingoeca rosetta (strain ATCC 50818 / BSB-021) TaxID=946362 RepID=F2U077_SALR5|nr:uncharacterized protein PTSG_01394 [Salpingoeca rosetta]EGD80805.1 hypothetical protein PTSG_01394 [Salpingoeca rosetta]|eukprot:XP_004997366.1 hypothetical protein PTSG_01394 [Salpingoeca rosetta]
MDSGGGLWTEAQVPGILRWREGLCTLPPPAIAALAIAHFDEEPNLRLLVTSPSVQRERRTSTLRKGMRIIKSMRSRSDLGVGSPPSASAHPASSNTKDELGCKPVSLSGTVRDALQRYVGKAQLSSAECAEVSRIIGNDAHMDTLVPAWKETQLEFGTMLVATMRWWTTPLDFFNLITAFYSLPDTPPDSLLFPRFKSWANGAARSAWKQAICRFIRCWATLSSDFADQSLYGAFLQLQSTLKKDEILTPYGLDALSNAVVQSMEENTIPLCPPTHSPGANVTPTLSLHPKAKFGNPLVRTVSGEQLKTLAHQITALEWDAFSRITPHDVNSQTRDSKRGSSDDDGALHASRISHVIDLGNRLRMWAVSQVLQGKTTEDRAETIAAIVELCMHLKSLKNFSSLMSIHGAFSHAAVGRLKHSFASLPKHISRDLQSLDSLLSPLNNHEQYRKLMNKVSSLGIPFIPYIAVLLKDAMSIEHKAKTIDKAGGVDVHKLYSLASCVDVLVRKAHVPKVQVDIPLLISLKHTLQQQQDSQASDNHLYERSLTSDSARPRTRGRSRLSNFRRTRRLGEQQYRDSSQQRESTSAAEASAASTLLTDLHSLGLANVTGVIAAKFEELACDILMALDRQLVLSTNGTKIASTPRRAQSTSAMVDMRPLRSTATSSSSLLASADAPPSVQEDVPVISLQGPEPADHQHDQYDQHNMHRDHTANTAAHSASDGEGDGVDGCAQGDADTASVSSMPASPKQRLRSSISLDARARVLEGEGRVRAGSPLRASSGDLLERVSPVPDHGFSEQQYARARSLLMPSLPPFETADINRDQAVDKSDLAHILLQAYMATTAASTPAATRPATAAASVGTASERGDSPSTRTSFSAMGSSVDLLHTPTRTAPSLRQSVATIGSVSSLPSPGVSPTPSRKPSAVHQVPGGSAEQKPDTMDQMLALQAEIAALQKENAQLRRDLQGFSDVNLEDNFTLNMVGDIAREENANLLLCKEDSLLMVMRVLQTIPGFQDTSWEALRVLAEYGTRQQYGANRTINVSSSDEFHLLVHGHCQVYLRESHNPNATSNHNIMDFGEKVFSVGSGASFMPCYSKTWTLVSLCPALIFTMPSRLVTRLIRLSSKSRSRGVHVSDVERLVASLRSSIHNMEVDALGMARRTPPQYDTAIRAARRSLSVDDAATTALIGSAWRQSSTEQDMYAQDVLSTSQPAASMQQQQREPRRRVRQNDSDEGDVEGATTRQGNALLKSSDSAPLRFGGQADSAERSTTRSRANDGNGKQPHGRKQPHSNNSSTHRSAAGEDSYATPPVSASSTTTEPTTVPTSPSATPAPMDSAMDANTAAALSDMASASLHFDESVQQALKHSTDFQARVSMLEGPLEFSPKLKHCASPDFAHAGAGSEDELWTDV